MLQILEVLSKISSYPPFPIQKKESVCKTEKMLESNDVEQKFRDLEDVSKVMKLGKFDVFRLIILRP